MYWAPRILFCLLPALLGLYFLGTEFEILG